METGLNKAGANPKSVKMIEDSFRIVDKASLKRREDCWDAVADGNKDKSKQSCRCLTVVDSAMQWREQKV